MKVTSYYTMVGPLSIEYCEVCFIFADRPTPSGAGWSARRLPAETLENGRPPPPACAAMHQRNTRAHTSPLFTRQQAPHACHAAQRARIPSPSRASKPRTPAASNAAKASFVAQGGTQGLRPPRLLRTGARRRQHVPPCTNATHAHTATPTPSTRQRAAHACHTAHAHCHTSAIHAPASRARLPHPAGARIPPPSRASKPRAPAHPAASNAARASWWRRWSWRWE